MFGVGFGLGLVLIGFIHQRRAAQGPEGTESMAKKVIRDVVSSTGVKPLPEGTPEALRQSRLHSFDVIESPTDGSQTTVWNLEMLEGMWPWIRVSSRIEPGDTEPSEVIVAAGDRILVKLREGIAFSRLDAFLEEKGYKHLSFYKSTGQYVIGIDPGLPLTIPVALKRFQSEPEWVESADYHLIEYF